jgi:hypothetical protein
MEERGYDAFLWFGDKHLIKHLPRGIAYCLRKTRWRNRVLTLHFDSEDVIARRCMECGNWCKRPRQEAPGRAICEICRKLALSVYVREQRLRTASAKIAAALAE